MKRHLATVAVALVGVAAVGLLGGDPRGAASLGRSEWIVLGALVWCAATAALAWRGARVSAWWLVPTAIVTVLGALSGWIAGVEFAGATGSAVRLAAAPGKVAFLVAMTSAGMALPTIAMSAIARRLARG